MAVKIVIDLQAASGKGDELAEMFRAVVPGTRTFAGCSECAVFRNQDDAEQFSIIETFSTREAYQAYLDWRVAEGTMEKLGALLGGAPTTRFFDDTGA